MIKIFLSHPMSGLTEQEVWNIRGKAIEYFKTKYPDMLAEFEIIENYKHDDAPKNAGRLWHLGRSIQQLAEADYIYFCDGWEKAKGCNIEYQIALSYGISIID